jgi:hypothetical protein
VSAPARGRRPALVIAHGEGSVSALVLAAVAEPICDLVWLVDSGEPGGSSMLRVLRRLGTVVDAAGLSEDAVAGALGPLGPEGIVAYADRQIPLAAAVGERLGLDYHDRDTARRLVDKLAQRDALRAAGVPVPACAVLPARASAAQVDEALRTVTFPAVVKPRSGAGSRDTVLVQNRAELDAALAATGAGTAAGSAGPVSEDAFVQDAVGEDMVVEQYIPGAPVAGSDFGDYVSVESVVTDRHVSHVAVTGRFPPAEPFRESGFFIPSALPAGQLYEVLQTAAAAIGALGVRTGFLHTEVKLTPAGPRVIEVNGRLGGGIPEMLELAAGVDLFGMSQRLALGQPVVLDGPLPTTQVAYLLYVQAPPSARTLAGVEGLDALGDAPGVHTIVLNRRPGDALDWREGNFGHVFSVLGTVPDHEALAELWRTVEEKVTVSYG